MTESALGVAEAKRRFSELLDRVGRGERFIVERRGKPVVAFVPPQEARPNPSRAPLGLAAVAGALADWDELDAVVDEIYAARRSSRDRQVPSFE